MAINLDPLLRHKMLAVSMAAAIFTLIVGALVFISDQPQPVDNIESKPVFDIGDLIDTAPQTIQIKTADDSFRIVPSGSGWVIPEADNYPVETSFLQRNLGHMTGLETARGLSRKPERWTRLGLDDPAQGGQATRVDLGRDGSIATVYLGNPAYPDDGGFIRRAGEGRAWWATGHWPQVSERRDWLDLDVLVIEPYRLAEFSVSPSSGRAYVIGRLSSEDDNFDLVEPRELETPSPGRATHVERVSAFISDLTFIDAAARTNVVGFGPLTRMSVTTFDGLEIQFNLFDIDDTYWLTIKAEALEPTQGRQARDINARTEDWVFGLSDADGELLMMGLP